MNPTPASAPGAPGAPGALSLGGMDGLATAAGVSVHEVRRTFGDVVAIDSMTLQAPPGKVTALIGPNGSGKTTLLLILATLLEPDSGEVRVAGFDPLVNPRQARAHLGWMPDVLGTWETLTCQEVLEFTAASYHLPRAQRAPRIADALSLVHLGDLAQQRTQVLSRGQKQRLGLARALVHDPSILLLDEPASGLDPRSRIELRTIVRNLAAAGTAVLISSHVLMELEEMADRAVMVAKGRTIDTRDLTHGPGTSSAQRAWLVRSLDDAHLVNALRQHHAEPVSAGPNGVTISVAGDEAAADLLAALIADGVRVTAFHPTMSELEQAYLELTKERV